MNINLRGLRIAPRGQDRSLSLVGPRRTACFTFVMGCPRSMVDASLLMEYFRQNGWQITDEIGAAELVLVGTCGFSNAAEQKSINYLAITSRLLAKDAQLIVFGCLAGINKERVQHEIDAIVIEPKNLSRLDEIIQARVKLKDIQDPNIIDETITRKTKSYTPWQRAQSKARLLIKYFHKSLACAAIGRGDIDPGPENAFAIRIAKGCMGNCSYCAIKLASGPLRSKPLEMVLSEFERGLQLGYHHFHLIGQDIGSYGQDQSTNIATLLSRLFSRPENFQLIWDDFNPFWLVQYFAELKDIFRDNSHRIVHFGFPIQSGSEKILKLMNRGYTAAEALRCLSELRQALPEAMMTSHVMIGFPSETKDDFNATLDFLKTVPFERIGIYKYDDRPNTLASQLPGKVTELVKYCRICKLRRNFKKTSSIQD